MEAKIYKANGEIIDVKPQFGNAFQLKELQSIVDGYIEVYFGRDGKKLIVMDEEGKLKGKYYNLNATQWFKKNVAGNDDVVGDVLICDASMVN